MIVDVDRTHIEINPTLSLLSLPLFHAAQPDQTPLSFPDWAWPIDQSNFSDDSNFLGTRQKFLPQLEILVFYH